MQVTGAVSDVLVAIPSPINHKSHALSDSNHFFLSSRFSSKSCPSVCFPKLGTGLHKCRAKGLAVKASGDSSDNLSRFAPLEFESSVGQLLAQILQTHPHLLPAAVDQQLENLQTHRDAQREETPSSQDLLHKRIAEVREKERRKALEEIIYCLIIQKFMDKDILMIPKISETSESIALLDSWPNQEHKLESVHSPEAFEMIQSHLSLVLGERLVGPLDTVVQMSKIKLGKLYAASIMYGYFLKRVDERFQLERTVNTLTDGLSKDQVSFDDPVPTKQLWDPDSLIRVFTDDGGESDGGNFMNTGEGKSYQLRSYVMYLDAETLQRYATIRSKEAISLIEKQTQALFGRPDIRIAEDGSIDTSNDEVLAITFTGLTMLVLEAVAFGSFLWVAESYVESKYHFVKS
ncbi:UV-B-induced protein At3g17800, chloroplastic [Quercus lobata]|uniref:UV-B-induced protein At3g17800, chloroplastic n=1 Tax=Quercus lobata TaxID=97700 RepID=UPI0012485D25|nr:UV-B-induced protein At3g17800, chloroplastic [Quercus lobata]